MTHDTHKMLDGYSLTTARILYRMPDFKNILQTFIWQEYDLAPKYPKLHTFLDFWRNEIEGQLHSVEVDHCTLISPADVRHICHEATLH